MEADIVAMGREIEMLERQAQLELELNAPVNTAIKNMPKGIPNRFNIIIMTVYHIKTSIY